MDRSSLLADVVAYINQLKSKVEELKAKVQEQLQKPKKGNNASNNLDHHSSQSTSSIVDQHHNNISKSNRSAAAAVVEVDVKIIGSEAMICVQTPNQDYPYAKLMSALKCLGLQVCQWLSQDLPRGGVKFKRVQGLIEAVVFIL
ncbi:hypothetical protein ACFX1Q_008386 [Malus domestica]